MEQKVAKPCITSRRRRLYDWFRTPLGESLMQETLTRMHKLLPDLFGYHILQLGHLGNSDLLEPSRISHRAVLDIDKSGPGYYPTQCRCSADSLPIQTNSVDVLLLPHVLEFERDPHQVLREADRVLIGDGHVVIAGFNPMSLWGIWHLLLAWRQEPPWNGRYLRLGRLKDWLKLLGFEIEYSRCHYFLPPFKGEGLRKRLGFLQKMGAYAWPMFGGIYLVVARKRDIPLTPQKSRWHLKRSLIAGGITEPSTRSTPLRKLHD